MQIVLKEKYLSPNKSSVYLIFNITNFSFKPGQFVILDNGVFKRPYSIASSPKSLLEKRICFYVKKVSEKGLSKYLTDDIQVGDKLELNGPFGHMILENGRKYLFVSIGSGIAPILSMLEDLKLSNFEGEVINIFGERFYDNIPGNVLIFLDRLMSNFESYIALSKEDDFSFQYKYQNINFYKGHVQDVLLDVLRRIDLLKFKIYLCGKPSMVDNVINFLVKNGVNKDLIKFEKY